MFKMVATYSTSIIELFNFFMWPPSCNYRNSGNFNFVVKIFSWLAQTTKIYHTKYF